MDNGPAVGLQSAPITKLLLGSILINSTVASVLDVGNFFSITLFPQLLRDLQLWRLGIWQLAYGSFGEVLFGGLTLYKLAPAERFMGSPKFAAFVLMAFGATSICVPAILAFAIRPFSAKANLLASGLTPTIFAILYQYHALIPSSRLFHSATTDTPDEERDSTGNWPDMFTDKFWIYALATQLATCRLPVSLVGAATGWLIGSIYHTSLPLSRWRLPWFISKQLQGTTTSTVLKERDSHTPEFRARSTAQQEPVPERGSANVRAPTESEIETLMSMMNVTRDVAMQAITLAGGSVERAIDRMLSA